MDEIMDEKTEWKTALVGVNFENRLETIKEHAYPNSRYKLVRQPDNVYDKNAVMVTANGHDIGFLPNNKRRRLADEIAPLLDSGVALRVHFRRMLLNNKTGDTVGIIVRVWE